MTILTRIALAGDHIFQVLAQCLMRIVTILACIEQVNTPQVKKNQLQQRSQERSPRRKMMILLTSILVQNLIYQKMIPKSKVIRKKMNLSVTMKHQRKG